MCDTSYEKCFELTDICKGNISMKNPGKIKLHGHLKHHRGNGKILFWAANPPDYLSSFSGSGLPFPNVSVAFENSPNKGLVPYRHGRFEINLAFPNSYYSQCGNLLHPPQIFFQIDSSPAIHTIPVGKGIPYRSLTYPKERTSCLFYEKQHVVLPNANQEFYLRRHGYPRKNKMPKNGFWDESA